MLTKDRLQELYNELLVQHPAGISSTSTKKFDPTREYLADELGISKNDIYITGSGTRAGNLEVRLSQGQRAKQHTVLGVTYLLDDVGTDENVSKLTTSAFTTAEKYVGASGKAEYDVILVIVIRNTELFVTGIMYLNDSVVATKIISALPGIDKKSIYKKSNPANESDSSSSKEKITEKTVQTIYYGCPGTGKSHEVKRLTEGLDDEKIIKFDDGKTNVFRTTFHPDYDYATFVGCYKPVKEDGHLDYRFVPQVFTNAYVTAKKHPDTPVYLIIEEINRGNCAQIFGDLFQLLDRENGVSKFPVDAEEELMKYLRDEAHMEDYRKISLPANLNIYATMNTSDQSLFPMDSAFKRRWEMKYIKIDYANKAADYKFTVGDKDYHWLEYLPCFNEKITLASDSEDKQMGEFFIRSNMTAMEFKNKVMFYLWNDVCKDLYAGSNSPQSFFFRDLNGKPFRFTELFNEPAEDAPEEDKKDPRKNGDLLLEGFLHFVKNGKKKAPKTDVPAEFTAEAEEGIEEAAAE